MTSKDFASTSEALSDLEAYIAKLPEELRVEPSPPPEPVYCAGCGGVQNEESPLFDSNACRCGGRRRRILSYLDAIDPERSMTFDALSDPDSSVIEAMGAALAVASGERSKGFLMIGKPGLGKTHLMVALGRALIDRERDCGYYNVARLVSRIQDSYSDYEGESRRAIIESVASHDVVLLDDMGKEHQSSNVESIVYELIDALYANNRTVVISTNVPPKREDGYSGKTLGERYDEAVRSRIKAMCDRFVIKGEDRRSWDW
jgi:DNA replication protein DnaC